MIVNPYILKLVQYSFILLWGSAAVLKLWDRELTKREMEMQVFPLWMSDILWWLLPSVQFLLIIVLLYKPTVNIGIKLSTLLISLFTIYLFLGVTKFFGETPCACGGIWPSNNHWIHIGLNSIFMIIGITYWVLAHKSHPKGDVLSEVGRKEGAIY